MQEWKNGKKCVREHGGMRGQGRGMPFCCFRQHAEPRIQFSQKDYEIAFFTTGSCPCQINNHRLTFTYRLSSHSPSPTARTSLGTVSALLREGKKAEAGKGPVHSEKTNLNQIRFPRKSEEGETQLPGREGGVGGAP